MQGSKKPLHAIFLASFLFFAHLALVMYINSTVLGHLTDSTTVSVLYVFGAVGAIALLFIVPHVVQKFGLVKTAITIFVLLAITLLLMGTALQPQLVLTIFVIYSALTISVWYCNDMFVAHYAKSTVIGHTLGTYLTINNLAVALMPVIAGALIVHMGFHAVYIVAASTLIIAAIIIEVSQRDFVDREYETPDIVSGWDAVRTTPSLRRIIAVNFLLQFFYAVMVIYSPLYLLRVAHFSWETIGLIFTIMLMSFVLLQYPIGRLSDRIGHKKLLIAGLLIAGISTIAFGVASGLTVSVILFTVILFCTRIGASMMEVLSESYFFKQVNDKDNGIISIYRMMNPFAYILAPLVGWLILSHGSYGTLFIALGMILIIGAWYSLRLVEIK